MIPPTDSLGLAADAAVAFAFFGIVVLAVVFADALIRERRRSNVIPLDPKRPRAPRKEPAAQ